MNINPLWRHADFYTLEEAACLIAGYSPEYVAICRNDTGFNANHQDPDTARRILTSAVISGSIDAEKVCTGKYRHIRMVGEESEGYWEPLDEISPEGTRISRAALLAWFTKTGIRPEFFFPGEGEDSKPSAPAYLDPAHPRYSPKLAAAIKVWEAMEDEKAWGGKGTVAAMTKWLSERWRELGLIHKDAINKSGISEVAKVANWKPEGGSPTTPSK